MEFENQNYLNEEKIIEKVVVSDARTIELFYNYDIVNSNYDFKVLNELVTEDMYSSGNNVLEIKLNTPLEKLASYILMISSLQDIYGRELVFDEILYDFFTDDSLLDQNIITEEPVSQNVDEEIEFVGNIDENEDNLEEIALNAATVPDT
ncbi:MAG: hypothetical protein LBQ59_00635 [Candidatus Peribacteria bacterium]|nr:hypothetical protein [Candidatus Peribacteria bacterium]